MRRLAPALAAVFLLAAAPPQDEMIDNPEFQAWSKQKPGAWVKWKMETTMGTMKMASDVHQALKEATAEKVVIDEKTTMDVAGQKQEQSTTRTLPAKIRKGTVSDGAKVEVVKEGDEELTIKGEKLSCHWIEMKLTGKPSGTMKVWRSAKVIGGAVKLEMRHEDAAKMTMTMVVVDWKAGS